MSSGFTAIAEQFKALSDPQRLRVVALCRAGELSVSELTEVLGQSQPRVSQHLKALVDAGLLDRFRDGKRVYYRLAASPSALQRRLVTLVGESSNGFESDLARLRNLRGGGQPDHGDSSGSAGEADRAMARALIELTLAHPVGDLLDVGCGRGRVLKLLAGRANRAVGIDVDSESRNVARIELFMAGADNCSLRKGDMHQLDFDDASFDTVILDDVLGASDRPGDALDEAARVLRPSGRILVLQRVDGRDPTSLADALASMSADLGLRPAAPKTLPPRNPAWLLSVLTKAAAAQSLPPSDSPGRARPAAAQR